MSQPVNLNKVRKDRARVAKKARADENAVAYGRSKAEKQTEQLRANKAREALDGHKRET